MAAYPPLVALVGRPNVGKSTLFNRLVGQRAVLVDDRPGVTRDRVFGEMRHAGSLVRLVDTGGFDAKAAGDMMARVRQQTQLAIDEADLVVLVLDAQVGLVPADREMAELLRRGGKQVIVAANKTDLPQHEVRLADLYELGLDPLMPISAEHGRGVGELCDLICELLDPPVDDEQTGTPIPVADHEPSEDEVSRVEWRGGPIRVAVIGRPNAGKSSLVNRMLGEERMLESATPGTTRDAVDSPIEQDGQTYVLVDTAGIRRKRSIADRLEQFSVMVAIRSLDRADVALVMFDACQPPTEQDAKVAALAHERGKGVVLVANKWDLLASAEAGDAWVADLRHRLPFLSYAPLYHVSARTGRGVGKLLGAVLASERERHRRVSTSELNRFFREIVERHPPPVRRGKRPRLYFVSQPLVRPPTFVFATSHPQSVSESYRRYLARNLRQRFGFAGSPIWIKMRGKSRTKSKR
jgi:GTP-binding protein